jgi:hypothetical protein
MFRYGTLYSVLKYKKKNQVVKPIYGFAYKYCNVEPHY